MIALLLAAALAAVPQAPAQRPAPAPTRPVPVDTAVDDARRAAAGRVLAASRFRERQAVLLDDSLRAAQADLTTECIERATAGQALNGCRATADLDPRTRARLAQRRSDMLDEIMAAAQTIYARRFTAAEMDEITRFFRTPVGQKYGTAYPDIIAEVQTRKGAIVRRYLVAATRSPSSSAGIRP